MSGYIQVFTDKGEILIEKPFYSRMHYTTLLAELMEIFTEHLIEITFKSRM